MRKRVCSTLFAMAIAVCTPFAYAIDVCKQAVCRVAEQYEGYDKAVTKFKAEMAFAFGDGFRMTDMFKASGLPTEVGWRHAQNV